MYQFIVTVMIFGVLAFSSATVYASSIHDAVAAGNVAEVQRLLDSSKALANEVNPKGTTPLQIACINGHRDLAEILLKAGAAVDQKNAQGLTPLMMAAVRGHAEVFTLLLDHGANATLVHPAFGSIPEMTFTTECRTGQGPRLTQMLIARGILFDPNKVSMHGLSPLRLAVALGNSAAITWLLDQGADINLTLQKDGRTPLNDAVFRGRHDAALLLLSKGADITIPDNDGYPPLLYATRLGNTALVDSFLRHGATVTDRERFYRHTALHLAAIKGCADIVRLLLDSGADADVVDSLNRTPLAYANQYGHRSAAAALQNKRSSSSVASAAAPSKDITRPLKAGEAMAWYLNNRGWAIRTGQRTLIFDSEEFAQVRPPEPSLVNGFIALPEISTGDVYAFYTCFHADSGELEYIHKLEDYLPKVTYIHNIDDPWRGAKNSVYLGPNENREFDGLKVRTFKTTSDDFMPTLTYLVQADGMNFVYVGFATDDLAAYGRAVDSIAAAGIQIDITFLPIPELEAADSSDLKIFLETLHPRAICLLDPDRREYLFPRVADTIAAWGYKTTAYCAQNPGDHFLYRQDR